MRIINAEYYKIEGDPYDYREIKERVLAESPLEVEVLRQAIVADKWDLMPEHFDLIGKKTYVHAARLCSGGGQAIFHPKFHQGIVLHYRVGDQIAYGGLEGFFELWVGLFEKQKGSQVGDFKLLSCLALMRRPLFQAGWRGPHREFFVCPWWYYFSKMAQPHGVAFKLDVQDFDNGPLFVSSLTEIQAEWDCLAPHMHLINPASITV